MKYCSRSIHLRYIQWNGWQLFIYWQTDRIPELTPSTEHWSVLQSQNAVNDYFSCKQLLHFGFAGTSVSQCKHRGGVLKWVTMGLDTGRISVWTKLLATTTPGDVFSRQSTQVEDVLLDARPSRPIGRLQSGSTRSRMCPQGYVPVLNTCTDTGSQKTRSMEITMMVES